MSTIRFIAAEVARSTIMADEQWQHLEVKDPVEHRTARQLNDTWASLPHAAQRGLSISSVPSAITRRCSLQLSRAGSHMRDHVESCKSRCSEVRAYKLDHLRRRRGSQAAYDQRHSRRRCGVGHGRRRSAKRASSRAFLPPGFRVSGGYSTVGYSSMVL